MKYSAKKEQNYLILKPDLISSHFGLFHCITNLRKFSGKSKCQPGRKTGIHIVVIMKVGERSKSRRHSSWKCVRLFLSSSIYFCKYLIRSHCYEVMQMKLNSEY